MQTTATLSELVRTYFSAWENNDRAALVALLASDFTFSSPNDDYLNQAEYWETCWPNSESIRAFQFLSLLEDGNEVFIRYECELVDGARFRNMEHFTFDGNKVTGVDVYFGRPVD